MFGEDSEGLAFVPCQIPNTFSASYRMSLSLVAMAIMGDIDRRHTTQPFFEQLTANNGLGFLLAYNDSLRAGGSSNGLETTPKRS